MLTLSIASLRTHHACDLETRIADLRRVLPDVTDDQPVPLRVWWDLPSTSVLDRCWSLRAVEPALPARVLGVRAAAAAARRVLHLTREQDRPVCLAAVEAAEAWAAEPTEERRWGVVIAARAAAYAADAARVAYAVHAARAAAHAANAARAAAHAANAAPFVVAYAAAAAAADAAAAAAADAAADDDAERAAQRADLDRLLAEVARG